jgi:hypothetical protein
MNKSVWPCDWDGASADPFGRSLGAEWISLLLVAVKLIGPVAEWLRRSTQASSDEVSVRITKVAGVRPPSDLSLQQPRRLIPVAPSTADAPFVNLCLALCSGRVWTSTWTRIRIEPAGGSVEHSAAGSAMSIIQMKNTVVLLKLGSDRQALGPKIKS